jgi:hypothetical protein
MHRPSANYCVVQQHGTKQEVTWIGIADGKLPAAAFCLILKHTIGHAAALLQHPTHARAAHDLQGPGLPCHVLDLG